MTKKSTLTTLVAIAMIASSVVVVHHAFADTTTLTKITSWGKGNKKGEIAMPGVMGTVTSINGTTITLTALPSKTIYTVDASAAKIRTGSSTSTLNVSDIHVGDLIMVKGTVHGASVAATAIFDGKFPAKFKNGTSTIGIKISKRHNFAQNKLAGSVQSISGNVLTVMGTSTSYTIDASKARVMDVTKKKGAVSNIEINDNVTVVGRQLTGSSTIDAFVVSDISRTF